NTASTTRCCSAGTGTQLAPSRTRNGPSIRNRIPRPTLSKRSNLITRSRSGSRLVKSTYRVTRESADDARPEHFWCGGLEAVDRGSGRRRGALVRAVDAGERQGHRITARMRLVDAEKGTVVPCSVDPSGMLLSDGILVGSY